MYELSTHFQVYSFCFESLENCYHKASTWLPVSLGARPGYEIGLPAMCFCVLNIVLGVSQSKQKVFGFRSFGAWWSRILRERACGKMCVSPETAIGQRKAGGSHVVNASASGWQVSSQTAWSWRGIPSILFLILILVFPGWLSPYNECNPGDRILFPVLLFKITCVVDHLL